MKLHIAKLVLAAVIISLGVTITAVIELFMGWPTLESGQFAATVIPSFIAFLIIQGLFNGETK